MSASPDLHDADKDDIVSACKTYYETVRRSFRYKHPDLASQAEAVKRSARSRARRKRLLEARQSVLAEDEVGLWKCATIDLMSDEEDGIVGGVSGLGVGQNIDMPIYRRPSLCDTRIVTLRQISIF
ncbi:hypothetical protein DPX16_22771 [Anabarilius grahami]|uniref:Uncharacterized protein n=1 Tax=Anabarilius grahami TaxID=495550 RepID=A0A3N0YQF8_ANAGA|nr:hypothetical protein DPX16_22771 [Anabarilius grahami]